MAALIEVLLYLLQTLFSLFCIAVLVRFLLQWSGADFYNPISQFLVKVTAPLLNPLRKLIPGYLGIDMAALVLALIVQAIAISSTSLLVGFGVPNPFLLLIWAPIGVLAILLNIYFFAILANIVVSWVAPGTANAATMILYRLTEPVMAPFRKMLPSLGGLDLSPILVFVSINIGQIVLRHLANASGLHPGLVLGL
ncbi:MAG: YggT family protein [Halieaceae bacterium]|jgi:YggT family protein